MYYRLRNQRDESRILILTFAAWFSLLELGETFGWNPMSAVLPDHWIPLDSLELGYDLGEPGSEGGNGQHTRPSRLMVLEDALNLADALERAFLEYDPPVTERYTYLPLASAILSTPRVEAGIGAMIELINFCQMGAFWIEAHP